MTHSQMDPDEAERLDRQYWNTYAADRRWEEVDYLEDPAEDLDAFFRALPGTRILDVGCGWARYVYRFLDHGLDYTGIDIAPAMVDFARIQYPEERFEQMSLRKLEFANDSFDGLWCCCALSGIPKHELPAVLRELQRALVPGGVMGIIMPCCGASYEEVVLDRAGEPMLHASFYVLEEFVELLKAAGFSIIDSINLYQDGAFSVLVQKPN